MNTTIETELAQMGWLARLICRVAMRNPYWHLQGYMDRWWLMKERWIKIGKWQYQLPAIRLHRILRSDGDRHMHDHPRHSISLLLWGRYREVMPLRQEQRAVYDQMLVKAPIRTPWRPIFRKAHWRHRLELYPGTPVYSLFITWGPRREWGFYVGNEWVHWQEYVRRYQLNDEMVQNLPEDIRQQITGGT